MLGMIKRLLRRQDSSSKKVPAELAKYHDREPFDPIGLRQATVDGTASVYLVDRLLATTTKCACLKPAEVPNGSEGTTVQACPANPSYTDVKGVCPVCDLVCRITEACADLPEFDCRKVLNDGTKDKTKKILFRLLEATHDKECLTPVRTYRVMGPNGPSLFRCGECQVCVLCDEIIGTYVKLKKVLFGLESHQLLE